MPQNESLQGPVPSITALCAELSEWAEQLVAEDRGTLTADEERPQELLTLPIEDFEEKHYDKLRPAGPAAIVPELMAASGPKQVDLTDVFGTLSVVSEVLAGKRELSRTHIQKLSQRFHVSPELFFPVR